MPKPKQIRFQWLIPAVFAIFVSLPLLAVGEPDYWIRPVRIFKTCQILLTDFTEMPEGTAYAWDYPTLKGAIENLADELNLRLRLQLYDTTLLAQNSTVDHKIAAWNCTNILSTRVCNGATRILQNSMLHGKYKYQFNFLDLRERETLRKVGVAYHTYLIAYNYFGNKSHLYIDPTIHQFFPPSDETEEPFIFVGDKATLVPYLREHGLDDQDIENYFDSYPKWRRALLLEEEMLDKARK